MRTAIEIPKNIFIAALFILGFAIINSHVSLTFEIDEPKLMFKDKATEIEASGQYLRDLIFWLKVTFVYVLKNIAFLTTILIRTKNESTTA